MTKEPVWINHDVVLAIHKRQIAEHGGSDAIRDKDLLESALGKPKNLYYYEKPKPSIAQMAASYAYGIAKNHPFIDGNKRTAFVVCMLFLQLNNLKINASQEDKYRIFLGLADGSISEEMLSNWISTSLFA